MKKVVYSVTRYRREDIDKMSGLGYITDTDLVIACVSKAGKPYIRVFEDCVKDCHPIPDKPDEFKGAYYEIREVQLDTGKDNYETREFRSDVISLILLQNSQKVNVFAWFLGKIRP